uniref:Uncharacterized protein n=1 Tax=Oryza brachyantha TaxID=4533 RepID=J3MA45_ORYBR
LIQPSFFTFLHLLLNLLPSHNHLNYVRDPAKLLASPSKFPLIPLTPPPLRKKKNLEIILSRHAYAYAYQDQEMHLLEE